MDSRNLRNGTSISRTHFIGELSTRMCYVNFQEPVPHASLPDSMRNGYLRSPTTHAEESNLVTSSQATNSLSSLPQHLYTPPVLWAPQHWWLGSHPGNFFGGKDRSGHIVFECHTQETPVEAADFGEKTTDGRDQTYLLLDSDTLPQQPSVM